MDNKRYEDQLHRQADRLHDYAQQTGEPVDYVLAAEMYEKAGDYESARLCREAAARLGAE